MMPEQHRAACDLLYAHWKDGTQIDGLPYALRPTMRTDGYAIQAALETHTARPLAGWKIAATSVAGQKHIGVDGPMAGRLLAERAVANGGNCILGGNLMRVAELEFAFRMGHALPPRATPYSQAEVLDAVEALLPAIEIPDSRFTAFETAGAPQLIADNACAHRFLFGADAPDGWRGLDLAAHAVKAYRDGTHVEDGMGANVLGDPRIALTWLANELSAHGLTLQAGQTVITGTCVKPLAIAARTTIAGDFGVLGKVSIRIV